MKYKTIIYYLTDERPTESTVKAILSGIKELSKEEEEILRLYFEEAIPLATIARRLTMPVDRVEGILRTVLKKLKEKTIKPVVPKQAKTLPDAFIRMQEAEQEKTGYQPGE